jgi:glycerol-3-phosphate dehydrogenase
MAVLSRVFSRRTLACAAGGTTLFVAGGYWYLNSGPSYPAPVMATRRPPPPWTPPPRSEMLNRLKASGTITKLAQGAQANEGEELDLLIIGGGATGAGCAVDAASRGLKVALVERDDFSAGTSCILLTPSNFCDELRRDIIQVDKACTWRRSLPPEGCDGA